MEFLSSTSISVLHKPSKSRGPYSGGLKRPWISESYVTDVHRWPDESWIAPFFAEEEVVELKEIPPRVVLGLKTQSTGWNWAKCDYEDKYLIAEYHQTVG